MNRGQAMAIVGKLEAKSRAPKKTRWDWWAENWATVFISVITAAAFFSLLYFGIFVQPERAGEAFILAGMLVFFAVFLIGILECCKP